MYWVISFNQFINNFSALLLYKINVLVTFNVDDFIYIFVESWSIEILVQLLVGNLHATHPKFKNFVFCISFF